MSSPWSLSVHRSRDACGIRRWRMSSVDGPRIAGRRVWCLAEGPEVTDAQRRRPPETESRWMARAAHEPKLGERVILRHVSQSTASVEGERMTQQGDFYDIIIHNPEIH